MTILKDTETFIDSDAGTNSDAGASETPGYAGDLTSRDAFEILNRDQHAVLLDVRTEPEWRLVGSPDLAGIDREPIFIAWQLDPDRRANPDFWTAIAAHDFAPDQTILILCRSGVRSREAAIALSERGHRRCYNIADGFEGPKDLRGRRGRVAGWKVAGLPWRQD